MSRNIFWEKQTKQAAYIVGHLNIAAFKAKTYSESSMLKESLKHLLVKRCWNSGPALESKNHASGLKDYDL